MLGGLGNLTEMLKQAKDMKARMEQMQADLAAQRHAADAGGGTVTATVDGKGHLVDIKIDPEAAADVELLEDLIKGACAAASRKATEHAQAEMAKLTGGLNIPGLSDMLGGAS